MKLARWFALLLSMMLLSTTTPALATVNDVLARDDYVGNSSTTIFPYTFRILIKDDIEVLKNGVVQNLDTDYSVGGVGNSAGGTITFANPPATGVAVTLLRKQPDSQLSVYLPNEAFPATRLEKDLDKNTMLDQEQAEQIRRAPKFFKQSLVHDINVTDPVNGLCLAWEATATPSKIVNVPCGSGGGGGSAISLNSQTWAAFPDQFFGNDANVTISSGSGIHTLGWTGCLPVSRGGIGACAGVAPFFMFFETNTSVGESILAQESLNALVVHPGTATLQTLKTGAAVGGAGAAFLVRAGNADTGSSAVGGALGLAGGLPDGAAAGGFVQIDGAAGTPGGGVTITAGQSTTGAGAQVAITAGTSLSGAGGDLVLSAGIGTGGLGGNVVIAPGSGTTTGDVTISALPDGNVIINGLTYPLADGTAGQAIVTDGAGTLSFASGGTGTTTGSGVAKQIAVWTTSSALGGYTDFIWDDASANLDIGGNTLSGATDSFVIGEGNTADSGPVYIHGNNNDLTGASDAGAWGEGHTIDTFDSYALGEGCTINGSNSVCVNTSIGSPSTVTGTSSSSIGSANTVDGNNSHAWGEQLDVSGFDSAAFGELLTVTHNNTYLFGQLCSSTADNSMALCSSTVAELTVTPQEVLIGQIGSPTTILKFAGSTSGSTSLKAGATPTPTTFVLPTADGSAGTCISTDGAGNLGWANCSSGGTGLTSLGGQTGATQTFAKVNDTNVTLTIGSATDIHTFTMGWAGTLANTRGGTGQNSSAWSALPLVTAGTWSQFAGSACSAGQVATSISASGVLTCAAAGSGTVTHTGGNLTLNRVLVGAGGADLSIGVGADEGVYFAQGGGQLSQDTSFFGFDSTKHTLKLGFGGAFATQPWLSPPLLASPSAEIGFATGATGPKLTLTSTNGTIITPTASVVNNILGTVEFKGFDGTNGVQGARMYTVVQSAVDTGVIPTNIVFETTDIGGVKHTPLTLRNNGNINLGGKIIAYGGLGAANGSLLIGNSASGRWDASTLIAGPGVSITNGPGTIQISTTASQCVGGGRVTISDTTSEAVVTFGTPMSNANYAMSTSTIPGAGAASSFPIYVKNVTTNGFTVVLSAAPGAGFSTSVAWIATPSTCTF